MCKWLVVSENIKFTPFQEVAKMADGEINGEQLATESTIFSFSRLQTLGQKGNGLPGVIDALLKNSTHGDIRSIDHKAVWCRRIRMSE